MRTLSPTEKWISMTLTSTPSASTSSSVSGTGREPGPTKPVTPGRVADDVPAFVVHDHFDEDVAREELSFDFLFFLFGFFHDRFRGDAARSEYHILQSAVLHDFF